MVGLSVALPEDCVVSAADVLAKIKSGQPADFENCTIIGDLNFSTLKIDAPVHFNHTLFKNSVNCRSTVFSYAAYFRYSNFNETAYFSNTTFNEYASFSSSKFNGDANFWESIFNGDTSFESSTFNGGAYFSESMFNGTAGFESSKFNGDANFWGSIFNGDANFLSSIFNGDANFGETFGIEGGVQLFGPKFNGGAFFSNSTFNGTADFVYSKFNGTAYFLESAFNKKANFNDAKFEEFTDFNISQFKDAAFFEDAIFNDKLALTRTSYDKLYIRWGNIKKGLVYDDSAYLSLIKNFEDLGYFEDSDNCYFQYRKDRRGQPWPCIYPLEEPARKFIDLLSEWSYGYGTRPANPFIGSLLLIGLFGLAWRRLGFDKSRKSEENKAIIDEYAFSDTMSLKKANDDPNWPILQIILSVLESFGFSAVVFLSGTRFLIDAPEIPEMPERSKHVSKYIFNLERITGAIFMGLFLLAISRTVIRAA